MLGIIMSTVNINPLSPTAIQKLFPPAIFDVSHWFVTLRTYNQGHLKILFDRLFFQIIHYLHMFLRRYIPFIEVYLIVNAQHIHYDIQFFHV